MILTAVRVSRRSNLLPRLFPRSFASSPSSEIPIQYMHGQPHPAVQPKGEYPEWLWQVGKSPTLGALEKKYKVRVES